MLGSSDPLDVHQFQCPASSDANVGRRVRVQHGPRWDPASSPSTPIRELRARFEKDGYLFLKNLLPRNGVLTARRKYFELLAPSGVLAPSTAPVDGIFNAAKDPQDFPGIGAGSQTANGRPTGPNPEIADKFVDLAFRAHGEPWYADEFCKHPALRDFVAEFTGWGDEDTLGVRRSLFRNNTPGKKAIGVHYDQILLRHGEDTSITAWVPMGDVAIDGGGLIYLEGGHEMRRQFEREFGAKARACGMGEEEVRNAFNQNMMSGGLLAGGPKAFGEQAGRRWLLTAFEAGDVVLRSPYTVSSCLSPTWGLQSRV